MVKSRRKTDGKLSLHQSDAVCSVNERVPTVRNNRLKAAWRNQFRHRVLTNLLQKASSTKNIKQRYCLKWNLENLINEACRIKRKLFIKILNRMKILDKTVKELGENCVKCRKLNATNFCSVLGGRWGHNTTSERYFQEECYHVQDSTILAVRETGRCYQIKDGVLIDKERKLSAKEKVEEENEEKDSLPTTQSTVSSENQEENSDSSPHKKRVRKYRWNCTARCNIRKQSCTKLRKFFITYNAKQRAKPKMKLLYGLDNCPVRKMTGLLGHSIACLQEGVCPSVFHHIRMLSSHHTGMRALVRKIYFVTNPINHLEQLNKTLTTGTAEQVRKSVQDIKDIFFHKDLEEHLEVIPEGSRNEKFCMDYLLTTFGKQMAAFEKEAKELPTYVCVSCRRTIYKKQMKTVDIIDKVGNNEKTAWAKLMLYLVAEEKYDVLSKIVLDLYCCKGFDADSIPPRSVLNEMDVDPIPECLQNLNVCEIVSIQTVHPFKIVVRLQAKTARIPSKELAHGLKGKIVYLPIDLHQNIETLHLEDENEPSLMVIVNGVPTKDRKIWQQLLDVGKVRRALQYLKENNEYYKELDVEKHLNINIPEVASEKKKGQFRHVSNEERIHLYEQYTVHPLDNREVMGDALELFQMEKATGLPMNIFEKSLEVRSFPMLFPNGRGGRLDDRPKRISSSEYRTTRILSVDSRFRLNIDYLFHLLYETEFSELCYAVAHVFSTGTTFKNLSAADMLTKIALKDEVLETKITNLFASMRGTKAYWLRRNAELRCMMRHFGPPTWFITFSCAEYSWNELADFIRLSNKDIPNIMNMTNAQLCAMDPVLMSRFFQHRWLAMLHFLLNKESPPVGEVEHYFWRREYQARGAPHIHALFWIKDAPKMGENTDEEVIEFIEKYVTCDIPREDENVHLREKVLQFQQHKCSKYCHRKFKSRGRVYTKCRFGFPRPVRDKGVVNNFLSSVRHSVSKKSPKDTYNVKRSIESRFINDYTAVLLLLWCANIDIQFISDNALGVARYVTGYVTKMEKSVADSFWSELAAIKSERAATFSTGLKGLHDRVCGAPESADRIQGVPLHGRSETVKYLCVGPAVERKRVLKALREIQEIAAIDPNRTDIVKNNLIDTYYPQRCDAMEDMCLYEVAEQFTFRNLPPDEEKKRFAVKGCSGSLVRHQKKQIINHYRFSMETEEKKERTYFCLLQLYKPWRKEEELIGGHSSYEAAFNAAKEEISNSKMEQYLQMLQSEMEKEANLDEELMKHTPESSQSTLSGSQQLLGEPQIQGDVDVAMEEVEEAMEMAQRQETDLATILKTFNAGQRTIYTQIIEQLEKGFAHSAGVCKCAEDHQVLQYISGEAGTGKSYLIRAFRTYLQEKFAKGSCCVVAAPTGIAAFNVGGVTLHRLLMLPVEQEHRLEYVKLSSEAAQTIGRLMRQVKLVIIDEISMVSNLMLTFVHLRLQEVLRSSRTVPFGGINVLVFGDLLQLTPVKGEPVFKTLSSKDANNAIGSIGNVNLWSYFKFFELIQNMRQAKDLEYSRILQGVRIGLLTEEVKTTLESRLIGRLFPEQNTPEQVMKHLHDQGVQSVALMPTIVQCDTFNNKMMIMENNEIISIDSVDALDGETIPLKLDMKVQKRLTDMETKVGNTAGLERKLKLCVNSRVMLRRNLNVESGLVNGAMGRVSAFVKEKSGTICFVKVKFDHCEKESLICRVSARFKLFKDVYVRRSQFPLCSAYAITVHKSQGLTLDSAIVNIGSKVFKEGIVYVALSRIKELSGLYIMDFDSTKVKADISCLIEYNRLRSTFMPELSLFPVPSVVSKKKEITEKSEKVQQKSKTLKNITKASGLSNPTAVECYCNSAVQLMMEMDDVMNIIKSQTGQQLCTALTQVQQELEKGQGEPVTAQKIRFLVGQSSGCAMFMRKEQQDAQEFLSCMLDVLEVENVNVRNNLEISYRWDEICEGCGYIAEGQIECSNFLMLGLPEGEFVDFNCLINKVDKGTLCSSCGEKSVSSLKVLSSENYVLLMLNRSCDSGLKNNIRIVNYKYGKVKFGGTDYETQALVSHEGERITSGHYITWKKRRGHWLKCNDSIITTECRAPYSLKDVYLILLKCCSIKTIRGQSSIQDMEVHPTVRMKVVPEEKVIKEERPQTPVKEIVPEEKVIKEERPQTPVKEITVIKKRKVSEEQQGTNVEEMKVQRKRIKLDPEFFLIDSNVSRFSNETGIQCYCNSSLQLCLEIESLVMEIRKKTDGDLCIVLNTLIEDIMVEHGHDISTASIPIIVACVSGNPIFMTISQQDVQEFLMHIFLSLEFEDVLVGPSVEISYQWEHKCLCGVKRVDAVQHDKFLLLSLPDAKSVNVKYLFEKVDSGLLCEECGQKMFSTLYSLNAREHLILVLGRYQKEGIKKQVKIKQFKHAQLSVAGKTYNTKALIVHSGTNVHSGHYITWRRRKDHWLECNDSVVTVKRRAPNDLKDVYLILMKRSF